MTKKILIILGILVLSGIGYYAISPLFNNIKAYEVLPGNEPSQKLTSKNTPISNDTMDRNASDTDPVMKYEVGKVMGSFGHPASGTARIIETGGKKYIRYENFKTINGPDIYVYLSKDLDAKNYISLGKLKATEGNINYEIPASTNPSDYTYVLTWCRTFGVLFNSTKIN